MQVMMKKIAVRASIVLLISAIGFIIAAVAFYAIGCLAGDGC
jgi:hypothetical protein